MACYVILRFYWPDCCSIILTKEFLLFESIFLTDTKPLISESDYKLVLYLKDSMPSSSIVICEFFFYTYVY